TLGARVADEAGVGRVDLRARVRRRGLDRDGLRRRAGDQVERTRGRRAELGVERVVVERVVLRVVPQPGDGVAVVVVHDQARLTEDDRLTGADVGLRVLHEGVHLAAVLGLLLRAV